MFGYVQIRKPELKIKDYDTYHSFYCGLCHILYERFGIRGQVTLTYDMTFLVLLLSSYYESEVKTEKRRCIVHPARAHVERMTEMTAYGADMNVLLTYFHFVDDKQDEKKARRTKKRAEEEAARKKAQEKRRAEKEELNREAAKRLQKRKQLRREQIEALFEDREAMRERYEELLADKQEEHQALDAALKQEEGTAELVADQIEAVA